MGNVNTTDEHVNKLVLDVYPNPAMDRVTASWSGSESMADVRVFNMAGKEVAFWPMVRRGAQHTLDLPSGFYTIQIETADARTTKRLQILK